MKQNKKAGRFFLRPASMNFLWSIAL